MRTRALSIGALAAAAVGAAAAFAVLGWSAPGVTAAQSQYAPANTQKPTISDTTPEVGQTITATTGEWSGDNPKTYTYQWFRCNPSGDSCVAIPGTSGPNAQYTVQAGDQGNTLRVAVTATNAQGSSTAQSDATSPVGPQSTGPKDVSQVNLPDRLVVADVRFTPNPLRSRTASFTARVRVLDTNDRPIVGALVFLRSTPLVTSTSGEQRTGSDGWATITVTPERDFGIVFREGYNLQIFVRASKPGDDPLAGVSTRRLVQVGIDPS